MKLEKFIQLECKSPYLFHNEKTKISVDFRICPLMKKEGNIYSSSICKGCYSTRILSLYPRLRKKLENLPQQNDNQLLDFINDCERLKSEYDIKKIRFYSLADFDPKDFPYIIAASLYFKVYIISKILTFPKYEKYLFTLSKIPNMMASLSFNKNNFKQKKRIVDVIKENNIKNFSINYTMNYDEENPLSEKFRDINIFHFRNRNKLNSLVKFDIDPSRICCLYNENGRAVEKHGKCAACSNCDNSYSAL